MHMRVSVGEVVDRVTIDLVKLIRTKQQSSATRLFSNICSLTAEISSRLPPAALLELLSAAKHLYETNNLLWDLEDSVRMYHPDSEQADEFKYMAAATRISPLNDLRAGLKKSIDTLLSDGLTDHKSFTTKEI